MQFHLIGVRPDLTQRQDGLKLRDGHIAHGDLPHKAGTLELLHLAPCRHKVLHKKWTAVGIAAVAGAASGVIVWERPVQDIEVQIVKPQIFQGLLTAGDHLTFAMHIVPHLADNGQRVTLHKALIKRPPENTADLPFIAVHAGTVKGAVTAADCLIDRPCDGLLIVSVGPKGPKANFIQHYVHPLF